MGGPFPFPKGPGDSGRATKRPGFWGIRAHKSPFFGGGFLGKWGPPPGGGGFPVTGVKPLAGFGDCGLGEKNPRGGLNWGGN